MFKFRIIDLLVTIKAIHWLKHKLAGKIGEFHWLKRPTQNCFFCHRPKNIRLTIKTIE